MRILSTAVLTGFLATPLALAQTCSGPSALAGIVFDPSGAVIVHANVDVSSSKGMLRVFSDRSGRWSVPCLPLSEYDVEITSKGFRSYTAHPRLSKPGQTLTIKAALEIETATETLNVTPEAGVSSSGGANTLTASQLAGLAEDPDDLLRQLQDLAAASGSLPGKAIITVDGFQNASTLPPKSSIQEVRISPDMFSAEYQRPPYAGGRIEVFTKTGQDKFHGALFGVSGSHIWNANDPLALSSTPASKERIGFELSGPLLSKKRADFSLDFDHRSIDENAVVNASILSSAGTPTAFNQTIATPQRLWLGNARTSWQLAPKDTLSVSFAANVNSTENKGVGGLILQEAGYFARVSEYDLRAVNTTFLGSAFLHSARLGVSWKTTEQDPNSTAPQLEVAGAFTGGGSTAGQLYDSERDLEFDDEAYLSLKRHTIKAGAQILGASISNREPDTFNGVFTFGGGNAPVLDSAGLRTGGTTTITGIEQYRRTLAALPGGQPTTYSVTAGNAYVPLEQWTVALYAQDDWKLTKRISVSGGLRYFAQTSPTVLTAFAPRLGIAVALGKKQQWTVHARTGLFYSPIDSATSLETIRLDGLRQISTTVYSPSFSNPLGSAAATSPIQEERRFSSGIGISPSSQSQLSVEHTFFKSWSVNANAYYSASWGVLRSSNINAPFLASATGDPATAPRPLAPNLNLFEYGRTGRFAGPYAFLGVNHFARKFSLISGYLYDGFRTNADSPNTFPQSSYVKTGDWARPTNAATHVLFLVFIYSLPFKIESTTNLGAASGVPFDVTTGFDNNGDGVFNDRPQRVSSPGPGTYATRYGLLSTNTLNGDLPRNIGTMPATVHLDLSLSRSFVFKEKHGTTVHAQTLRFDARSANLLNHANYTAVDGVVGSPQFGLPVTADFGRRIELGARLSF